MPTLSPYMAQLKKAYNLNEKHGFIDTHLNRVHFFWSEQAVPAAPLIYEAGIVIIGQGHKIGYLDNQTFRYDPDHYLIVNMAIPFECETHATKDEPLLGIFIDIDLAELHELVALMMQSQQNMPSYFSEKRKPRGIEPAILNGDMSLAVQRLVQCLCSKMDSEILGHAIVKEVVYRALLGEHGASLYALTQHHTHYANIAKSLSYIWQNYQKTLTVENLADYAHMSSSVFHKIFKETTGSTPVQYIKKMRLNKAKSFIIHDNMPANQAAHKVGYESPSQFSREFKRYFGVSPKHAIESGYENLELS